MELLFRNAPHSGHFSERFLLIAPHEGHCIRSSLRKRNGPNQLEIEILYLWPTHAQSGRIVSGTTLSGQSENIRGVGVAAFGKCGWEESGCCGKLLEGGAAAESGIHVVPPLEFVAFAQLPTKQHDATVSQRREINQTTVKVL
jgi:hypothetical protein